MYIQEIYKKHNDVMNCDAGMVQQCGRAHISLCGWFCVLFCVFANGFHTFPRFFFPHLKKLD